MIWSDTEIANLALRFLGNTLEIADLETENSSEAAAIRAFWKPALYDTLKDFRWPFATKYASLGQISQVGDSGHINDEWGFCYSYPVDCLYFRRILSGLRVDTERSRVPFIFAYGTSGQVILTDAESAQCEYTVLVESTSRWPVDFVMAIAAKLAFLASPSIVGGDGGAPGKRAAELYLFYGQKAQANAVNEQQADPNPAAKIIRARSGA